MVGVWFYYWIGTCEKLCVVFLSKANCFLKGLKIIIYKLVSNYKSNMGAHKSFRLKKKLGKQQRSNR